MLNINETNKIITLTRGDTEYISFKCNIGTTIEPNYYELKEGDKIYFGLMEPQQRFEDALLKKIISYTDFKSEDKVYKIKFSSEDTENLLPGTYYYQIKIYIEKDNENENNESVYTIIPKTKFFIID